MKTRGAILLTAVIGFIGMAQYSGVANAGDFLPDWGSKPASFCNKGEICAVGEGSTLLSSFFKCPQRNCKAV